MSLSLQAGDARAKFVNDFHVSLFFCRTLKIQERSMPYNDRRLNSFATINLSLYIVLTSENSCRQFFWKWCICRKEEYCICRNSLLCTYIALVVQLLWRLTRSAFICCKLDLTEQKTIYKDEKALNCCKSLAREQVSIFYCNRDLSRPPLTKRLFNRTVWECSVYQTMQCIHLFNVVFCTLLIYYTC